MPKKFNTLESTEFTQMITIWLTLAFVYVLANVIYNYVTFKPLSIDEIILGVCWSIMLWPVLLLVQILVLFSKTSVGNKIHYVLTKQYMRKRK